MNTPGQTADDHAFPLPTATLLITVVGASLAVGAAWWAGCAALGREDAAAGLVAGGIVGFCTAAGLLVLGPWRPRPASVWVSIWLGQTIVRLLVTPLLTYLIYSATPFRAMSLSVAVGVVYLVAVTSEAAVLARHLRRSAPQTDPRPNPQRTP